MAVPVPQAAGTPVERSTAGIISPAWPAHVAGDVALMIVENGGRYLEIAEHAGFKEMPGSPVKTSNQGSAAQVYLSVFWCRATGSAMAAPDVKWNTDHVRGQIVTFRGCGATGNPWDKVASAIDNADDNSVGFPSIVTTDNDCLVVMIVGNSADVSGARASAYTNPTLTGIAEFVDTWSTVGHGSGWAVATGSKASAGTVNAGTASLSDNTRNCTFTIALTPVAKAADESPWLANYGPSIASSTGDIEVQWPAHKIGDIGLLIVENPNVVVALATPAGFVELSDSPQGTGAAGGSSSTGLSVFWKRAASAAEANPVVDMPATGGAHLSGKIVTIRGALSTASPFSDTAGSVTTPGSAAMSIPGGTSTVSGSLVVAINSDSIASSADERYSGLTNADLADLTRRHETHTVDGIGSGMYIVTGRKDAVGVYGATTATIVASTLQTSISMAIEPAFASDEASHGVVDVVGQEADHIISAAAEQGLIQIVDGGTEEHFLGRTITDDAGFGTVEVVGQTGTENQGSITQSGFWSREEMPEESVWTREFPDEV